jgi:hypothetical protein
MTAPTLDARTLTAALLGRWHGSGGMACCPAHEDRSPSLSIGIGGNGRPLVHCFAGCAPADVLDALRRRGLWPDRSDRSERPPTARPEPRPEKPRSDAWRGIWSEARSIGGTIADAYLVHRLGIVPDEAHAGALRFHPTCPFRLEDGTTARLPALVALMTDAMTGEAVGVLRTALRPDGRGKADMPGLGNAKKMLGTARGAVVRLTPDDEVTTGLHVAEGIETALRCALMGLRPIWAALSAGGIARMLVLRGIEALTILADHDANGTGQNAARECATRWTEAGCEVRIILPPTLGSDFADQEGGR